MAAAGRVVAAAARRREIRAIVSCGLLLAAMLFHLSVSFPQEVDARRLIFLLDCFYLSDSRLQTLGQGFADTARRWSKG